MHFMHIYIYIYSFPNGKIKIFKHLDKKNSHAFIHAFKAKKILMHLYMQSKNKKKILMHLYMHSKQVKNSYAFIHAFKTKKYQKMNFQIMVS